MINDLHYYLLEKLCHANMNNSNELVVESPSDTCENGASN
jgi:hypothetical protein